MKQRIKIQGLFLSLMLWTLVSCSSEPRAIKLGSDMCAHCKMTLTDPKFGGELVTSKGKIFIFDDVTCMATFYKTKKAEGDQYYAIDYLREMPFIPVDQAHFLKSEEQFRSPMGSSIAAFGSLKKIEDFMQGKSPGQLLGWSDLIK